MGQGKTKLADHIDELPPGEKYFGFTNFGAIVPTTASITTTLIALLLHCCPQEGVPCT